MLPGQRRPPMRPTPWAPTPAHPRADTSSRTQTRTNPIDSPKYLQKLPPNTDKVSSAWFAVGGAGGRPEERPSTLRSRHALARSVPGACCGCDQRPSLMERRWLYRSLLSLLLPSVLPGSDTVFPHHRMMKSLIVSEDLRKLPPHLSAPAVGAVLLLPLTFFSPPRAARQPPPRLDCASCLLLGGLGGGERGEILDSPGEAPVPSGALLPLAHPRRSQTHRIDPRRSDAPGDALSRAGRTPSPGRAPPDPRDGRGASPSRGAGRRGRARGVLGASRGGGLPGDGAVRG